MTPGDSTVAAVSTWRQVIAGKIVFRRVHKQRAEAFFHRARLFAKQADHIYKIRVYSHLRKESSKVFLTYAKPTPSVALIDETAAH
jgi:hypothetical protein